MTRHDHSQRSGRLPVTFVDLRVVDRFPPACDGSPLGVGWMRRQDGMKRDDDSQRGGRLAVTRPVHYTPPPPPPLTLPTENQLTARADRPLREPAHTVAFTTAVAIDGAGSVRRQTGIKTARTLPVDRNGAGSRPATNCAQNPPPALAAIQTHCCSDHRHAWRCNADPDVNLWKKEVRMILKEPHARAA